MLIIIAQQSNAQIKFKTICPENKIGKNDLLQIQFRIENASELESLVPPNFDQFTIVSGPNQEIGRFSFNGKIQEFTAISYYLRPLASGKFVISGAKAVVDGKEYRSNSISVEVSNNSKSSTPNAQAIPFPNLNLSLEEKPNVTESRLKPGEKIEDKIKRSLFLKLQTDKKNCFVGEPITANYKIYTRLNSQTAITEVPSYNGFSMSELERDNTPSIEKVDGKPYTVYTLRKVQLYPLQPGKFTLDPMVTNNTVTFFQPSTSPGTATDLLHQLFPDFHSDITDEKNAIEKTVTLSTQPMQILVKALPVMSAPKGFKGAVGEFSINAKVDRTTGSTRDAFLLEVNVQGKGNIKMVNAPNIHWPESFEVFESKQIDEIDNNKVPMEGVKTFQFPFVVNKAGEYKIDSISFSYFDPGTEKYITVKTSPISLKVAAAAAPLQSSASSLKKNAGFFLLNSTGIWALAAMLVAFIFIWMVIKMRRNRKLQQLETEKKLDDLKNQISKPNTQFDVSENPLADAHRALQSGDAAYFFKTLHASFKKYLSKRFDFSESEWSKKVVNEKMDQYNISIGTTHLVNQLIEEIEMNIYAKSAPTLSLNELYERAEEAISSLNKQISKTHGVN